MRRAAKIDANHTDVVQAFQRGGFLVLSLAACGRGVPDLLVYKAGTMRLVEVKAGTGKLTRDQEAFRRKGWAFDVVRGVEDVQTILRAHANGLI